MSSEVVDANLDLEHQQHELSDEEKEKIRASLVTIIKTLNPTTDEDLWWEARDKAEEALRNIGELAVPYAKYLLFDTYDFRQTTLGDRIFLINKCTQYTEKPGIPTVEAILDLLSTQDIIDHVDIDAYVAFIRPLGRYIWHNRELNKSPLMHSIYKTLKSSHENKFGKEKDPNQYEVNAQLLELIALTGDTEVVSYIDSLENKIPRVESAKLKRLQKDKPNKLPIKYLQKSDSSGGEFSAEEVNPPELNSQLEKKINEQLEKLDIEPTVIPLARITLYNFFKTAEGVSPEDLNKKIRSIRRWSQIERDARLSPDLPTVGIEIEIPSRSFDPQLIAVLDICKIRHDYWNPETQQEIDAGYFEINPNFTYSAFLQARILEEVSQLDCIPLITVRTSDGKSRRTVPENESISLHVNLGIPTAIKSLKRYSEDNKEMDNLATITTFAYVTPNRIYYRKTEGLFKEKYKHTSASEKDNVSDPADRTLRLELRTFEARDKDTYQLILDAQLLGAALFSSLKYKRGVELTEKQYDLVYWYERFEEEGKNLLSQYGIDHSTLDFNRYKAIELMQTTPVQQDARALIDKYTREMQKVGILK